MSARLRTSLILLARFSIALLGVLLLWVLLLKPEDASWQRLQKGQALRVAIDPSFPPFEALGAQGELQGFDVDLALEIGRRLNAPVTFVAIAFDGLADAVIADRVDAVISAFPLDERLTEDIRYSRSYFEAGLVMATRTDSSPLSQEEIVSRPIAVEWGSQGDAWVRKQGLSDVQRFETPDDALNAVKNKEVDVAIIDAVSAALYPEPGLVMHTPPLVSDPYVIALPKQSPKLAEAINQILTDMILDGTWQTLADKYFPNPPPVPEG